MPFAYPKSRPPNLLIITSSAGGGLLQAAVAQEQEARALYPQIRIIKRDVLKDWLWKWLGRFCIRSWNTAQKKGDVRSQKFFVSFHRFFDYISWPHVFIHTLRILFREDIDHVIDTQTTSTSAIMKAIHIFNRKRSKSVFLEKVMIDLPTRKATHFFRPIKSLSKKDKKQLKLRTITPLLEIGQTLEEFWQGHCGLSDSEIHYKDVIVRQPFRILQGKPRERKETTLSLRWKNPEELQLLRKAFQKGNIQGLEGDHRIVFDIPENARVMTVLLGSQPAEIATLNYVKEFVRIAQNLDQKSSPIYLFVFCADHSLGQKNSLFFKISDFLGNVKNYPSLLSVIPFSFQGDDVIAPLFHRSDMTCSRSGGGTAMELLAVHTGEMWVHSEAKKKSGELSLKELLKGIPVWESESALYLLKLKGAKIVTPETFTPHALKILQFPRESK